MRKWLKRGYSKKRVDKYFLIFAFDDYEHIFDAYQTYFENNLRLPLIIR